MSSAEAPAAAAAGGLLRKAQAAAAGLNKEGAALHDFRVALRRLMTVLRDFHLCPKQLKKLKKVFSATGAWRDAEVEAGWVGRYADAHEEAWALEPLIKELDESRSQLKEKSLEGLPRRFGLIAEQLSRHLAEAAGNVRGRGLKDAARPLLRRRTKKAVRALSRVRREDDAKRLHKARMAVKRLRYSLEPFGERGLGSLRKLQQLLGDLHDLDLILGILSAASSGGVADPAVLAKAAAAAREERRKLFHEVREDWLGPRSKRFNNIV